MHTDETLEILDDVTVQLGAEFRAFSTKTCSAFNTRELHRETEARKRRGLKKTKGKDSESSTSKLPADSMTNLNLAEKLDGPRPRKFNLQTYKYHALGDYANTIRRYGTSDSFSTEPVSNLDFMQSIITEIFLCRVNSSTVHQKLSTNALIRKFSSGS
jgi:hypothetical protein